MLPTLDDVMLYKVRLIRHRRLRLTATLAVLLISVGVHLWSYYFAADTQLWKFVRLVCSGVSGWFIATAAAHVAAIRDRR